MADPQTLPLILRNSVTAGAVPALTEFDLNTFVFNRNDGILYWKDAAGALAQINLRIGVGSGLSAAQKLQVRKNLGVLSTGYAYISANTSLTANAAGNTLFIQGGVTATLPQISSLTDGDLILLRGWIGVCTINAYSGDTISIQNSNLTTITLRAGQDLLLLKSGTEMLAFGYATPSGDAPSYNEDQRGVTTGAQRRMARLNMKARGSLIGGYSAAATLDGNAWGTSIYLFNGNYTITMPGIATASNGDSVEFVNISGASLTLAVASADTNCTFFFGKGVSQKTFVLQAGASCLVTCDGNNFLVFNNFAVEAAVPSADFSQSFSNVQRRRIRQNTQIDSDVFEFSATYVSTAADVGKFLVYTSAATANGTFDLPALSTLSNGDTIRVGNFSAYYMTARVNQSADQAAGVTISAASQTAAATYQFPPGFIATFKTNGTGWYLTSIEPGFATVRQGGGPGQLTNLVKIGWASTALKAAVDATDLGKIWTDFNGAASLAQAGYQKLPSGLIIQWGYQAPASADYTVGFPITYPTAVLFVIGGVTYNPNVGNIGYVVYTDVNSVATFNVRARTFQASGVSPQQSLPMYWISGGY